MSGGHGRLVQQQAEAFIQSGKVLGYPEAEVREKAERLFDYRELDYHYPIAFRLRRFVQRAVSTLTGRSKS